MITRLRSAFWMVLLALPACAAAQGRSTFCCTDDRAMQVCSDILPPVCYGRAYREISPRGVVVRKVEAPMTAEERAMRDAEVARAKEEERRRIDQERSNRALLATYTSEKDIEFLRDRKIADMEKAIQLSQEKYDEAVRRQAKLSEEAEFFKKKELPPELKSSLRDNESEMRVHQNAIDAKKKEIVEVRARYDEEKLRWIKLHSPRPVPPPENGGSARPR